MLRKAHLLFALGLVILGANFLLAQKVLAVDECLENTKINFVVRGADGSLIPNARVEVYNQTTDYNGKSKPQTRYAGGTTDKNLGSVSLSWRFKSEDFATYVVKVSTVSSADGAFWFYDNGFSCGEESTSVLTLSGIIFNVFEADGQTLSQTTLNIYSQLIDSSGGITSNKKEKLASVSTGYSGQAKVYLPQGTLRSLDKNLGDFYTLELSHGGVTFTKKDIRIFDSQSTVVNYYLSKMRVRLQDQRGSIFPSGTKADVYKQKVGNNNALIKGDKVGTLTIGDDSYGELEVNPDTYVLAVKGQTGDYQYFWNVDVTEGKTSSFNLVSDQSWSSSSGCKNASKLNLYLYSIGGNAISGLKYEVFEQKADANGLPGAGKKIGNGSFNNYGQASLSFKPDPLQSYVVKVWDKRADSGEFWFYDAARFTCNYDRSASFYIPTLKITLRDSQNRLKTNYNFSLYAQHFDSEGQPTFSSSDLIANLKTDANGQAVTYIAAYNPYRNNQTGTYVITAKDQNNNISTIYNIRMSADRDYILNYSFSNLGGELRDGRKKLLANKEISLYEQVVNGKNKELGSQLVKTKTNASGKFSFEYRPGTYALVVNDDFGQENIFWNVSVKAKVNNIQKLVLNSTKFTLTGGLGQVVANNATLKLYSLATDGGGKYYRDETVGTIKLNNKIAYYSLRPGYYLAVYTGHEVEYGKAYKAVNGSLQTNALTISAKTKINEETLYKF